MDIRECFTILGLEPSSSASEVKQAWRDLVKVWHPDRFSNNPGLQRKAEENLRRINEAYKELLSYFEISQALTPLETDMQTDEAAYSRAEEAVPNRKDSRGPANPDAVQGNASQYTPRPWVRYFARLIDYQIFAVFLGLVGAYTLLLPLAKFSSPTLFVLCPVLLCFLWIFVESNLLTVFGTTPGKWILRTSVNGIDGSRLKFFDALKRSYLIWLKGVALGIPLISFITMLASYYGLRKNERTTWDTEARSLVVHRKIGTLRTLGTLLIAIIFFPLANAFVGNIVEDRLRIDYLPVAEKSLTESSPKHDGEDRFLDYRTTGWRRIPVDYDPFEGKLILEMSKETDRFLLTLTNKSTKGVASRNKHKETRKALQTHIESLEVDEAPLERLCQLLSDMSKKRIIADDRIKGRISIRVRSCSLIELIDFILDEYNLQIKEDHDRLKLVPPNKMGEDEYYLTPSAYDNYVRGMALWAETRYQESLPYLKKAAEDYPEEAFLQNDLGVALAQKGDSHMALACFHEAISKKKNFAVAYYNIARLKQRAGENEKEALEYYASACNLGHKVACEIYKSYVGGGPILWYDEKGVPNVTDQFPPESKFRLPPATD